VNVLPVTVWPAGEARDLLRLVAALRSGALLVYPTETVYGIGTALSAGEAGLERTRAAKRSPPGRPYLLVAADPETAFSLWRELPAAARDLAARAWPGPLTLVGAARPGLPPSLLGRDDFAPVAPTVSVRVPGEPRLLALLRALGEPLVSTSANLAGAPPPVRFEDVQVSDLAPDLAIDGGPCPEGEPSTLVSVVAPGPPRLLRAGAWPWPP
jgi:L-threonylcarbamoyladenylate synthase